MSIESICHLIFLDFWGEKVVHHELRFRRTGRVTEVEVVVVASDRAHWATYHISAQGSQLARRCHRATSTSEEQKILVNIGKE